MWCLWKSLSWLDLYILKLKTILLTHLLCNLYVSGLERKRVRESCSCIPSCEREECIRWGCSLWVLLNCKLLYWVFEFCKQFLFGEWPHGSVSCKTRGSRQGWFVRRGDLVKGRSLGQRGDGGRELEGVQSCISPWVLVWTFLVDLYIWAWPRRRRRCRTA